MYWFTLKAANWVYLVEANNDELKAKNSAIYTLKIVVVVSHGQGSDRFDQKFF